MIKDMKIHNVEICNENITVYELSKKFNESGKRHLFVLDKDEKLKGLISPVDIINKVIAKDISLKSTYVKEIMATPVEFVDINQEVEFAMKIMMQRKTFTCPVTENGKLKGVVDYNAITQKIIKKINE